MQARPPDIIVSEPTPDINFENMEIKYLKQALASVKQPSTKAEVYLRYLEKCDFNTTLEPHSIIKFSENDVRSMVEIGQNPNGAEEVRQFLNKKQHKCSVNYLKGNFSREQVQSFKIRDSTGANHCFLWA